MIVRLSFAVLGVSLVVLAIVAFVEGVHPAIGVGLVLLAVFFAWRALRGRPRGSPDQARSPIEA